MCPFTFPSLPVPNHNDETHKLDAPPSHAGRRWGENKAARTAVEVLPTAVGVAAVLLLAWREHGSIAARHWLGYAILLALLLASLAAAGFLRRPSRTGLVAIAGLGLLAALAALSVAWSPVPALARDEALLTALYAIALALPLLTLKRARSRMVALGVLVAGLGVLTVATALTLRYGSNQIEAYRGAGRLYFPVTYVNAEAATMLIGFWPALVLGARRWTPLPLRALCLGLASAMLAGALLTQSRGGAIALAFSAVFVLGLSPSRLRLLVPLAIVLTPVAIGFDALTAPFNARLGSESGYVDSIRHAGETVLLAGLAALAVGLLYALVDRRLDLPGRVQRVLPVAAGAGAIALVLVAGALFVTRVEDPGGFFSDRWAEFKREPDRDEGETHFLNPGSNRYDFWRVAVNEFKAHPVLGAGSRSFGTAYLREGKSGETPARTHSLPLEVLAETGLVGFVLLVTALGAALLPALRNRGTVPGTAVIGAAGYWLVHAAGDWTWTFPACGIAFFTLVGIAGAESKRRLPRRAGLATAGACVLVALLAFAPVWLAARYVDRALVRGQPTAASDLRYAQALDPLSTEPYLIEAALAPTREQSIAALQRAYEQEPRSVRINFLLGQALLSAGRRQEARVALERAARLYPDDEVIAAALRQAR